MMWLGIVLHVVIIYTVQKFPLLPYHDLNTSSFADVLVGLIHSFRMPVFFILAGFFLLMLARGRGNGGMLRNRFNRLVLPFLLFWPPIFIVTVLMIMLFTYRAAHGTWGIDPLLLPQREGNPLNNTIHLWFLWMLMWFSVLFVVLTPMAKAIPLALRSQLSKGFEQVCAGALGFVMLALASAIIGANYRDGFVVTTGYFLPPLTEWLHNGLFFAFGLALYAHRSRLFPLYQKRWKVYAIAGFSFFLALALLTSIGRKQLATVPYASFWIAFVFNCSTWLFSFSLIGLFLRHFGQKKPVFDYLAQSSYWVYIIHFPITIGLGACLYAVDLSAFIKMPINIIGTTTFSLLSYHFLVRSTRLGRLLNGRIHPFTLMGWTPPHCR
jgi:fucose 4-O-acetylase-like acetyltransferase